MFMLLFFYTLIGGIVYVAWLTYLKDQGRYDPDSKITRKDTVPAVLCGPVAWVFFVRRYLNQRKGK